MILRLLCIWLVFYSFLSSLILSNLKHEFKSTKVVYGSECVNNRLHVQYNGFHATMLKYIFKNLLQFQWSSPFLALVTAATCLFAQLRTAVLRLIVRSWLDVPTFATRRLHACHHATTPSGGRWNCGRENVR
jgi:hypothetical protein